MKQIFVLIALMFIAAGSAPALAEKTAEMTRKMQESLANIKALVTGNDVSFNTGNDETIFGF